MADYKFINISYWCTFFRQPAYKNAWIKFNGLVCYAIPTDLKLSKISAKILNNLIGGNIKPRHNRCDDLKSNICYYINTDLNLLELKIPLPTVKSSYLRVVLTTIKALFIFGIWKLKPENYFIRKLWMQSFLRRF